MSYLAAFHAKTSPQRGGGEGLMAKDQECGEKWLGSFTKYSLDSLSWKTHQCSLLGGLEEFLETWPKWGLMRNGECWEQATLEQTTRGTDFGWSGKWPTPVADDTGLRKAKYSQGGTALSLAIQIWPTPTRRDYKGANGFVRTQEKLLNGERAHMGQLPNAVQQSMEKAIGGTLNPMWVEWLMGWPLGWTDLKPLEMGKSHSAQPQHGDS